MSFFTTILAALKWKADQIQVEPLTGVAYRIQADTTRTHRAYVDAEVTHRIVVEAAR